jgi:hypothetical protein
MCVSCPYGCGLQTGPTSGVTTGSDATGYANNANCEWMLAPAGAVKVVLHFSSFDTQKNKDFVRVFECQSIDCQEPKQLVELSGLNLGPKDIVANSGFMKVSFTSDSSIAASGFQASSAGVS